ncbi:Protein phosphatase 2C 2 [Rhizopus stolonifer]|uniref:protein-serine/threonine phosphatase n=1 Tax=Rhizopus stolonifer TaxID=4846 RepID=A0A367KH79_RHIST|nr:Protein phosphatase 2C 2 [Rhizopus stolonifer]
MGQILSAPVTTKHSTEGENKRLMYGASAMQGWRITMEDAHTHILDYNDTGAAFFGVFDGHGGSNVAKYTSQKLKENVIESDDFKNGNYKESLRKGFLKIDSDLRQDPEFANEASGCTAIVALLTKDNVLYVSNAGDSRAIISAHGLAIALSQDHKPNNPKETERIQKAGGHVEFGRVNGNLALSRALGDFEFKNASNLPPEQQAVTADPDITVHTLTEKDEFMVLACDGIWDCLTNQEVVNFVRKHIANRASLKEICEKLMDSCLADATGASGVGCDNMTVEIVAFLNGKTKEEWYDSIRESVKATSPSDITETSIDEENKSYSTLTKSESRQYSANELKELPNLAAPLVNEDTKEQNN